MKRWFTWVCPISILIIFMACFLLLADTPLRVLHPGDREVEGSSGSMPFPPEPGGENFLVCRVKEEQLLRFIQTYLLNDRGGIFSNTASSATGRETFSESAGLLMNYSILRNRKDLFDRVYDFFKVYLLAEGRYIRWTAGSADITCNAAVDDLRIMRALLDAYNAWGDKDYLDTGRLIQEGMYRNQVFEGDLCEFYDWRQNQARRSIPLCYLDLYTLNRLEIFHKGWVDIANRGLDVISAGRINDGSPFFYKYYSYSDRSYSMDGEAEKGGGICLTYTLYTVLHLAEVNMDTEFLTGWLKKEVSRGKLYAWYDPASMKSAQKMESTAVYALAAVYSMKVGEVELYRTLVDKMLQFMVADENSPYFGGFGDPETGVFYAFDNLTALWALAVADK